MECFPSMVEAIVEPVRRYVKTGCGLCPARCRLVESIPHGYIGGMSTQANVTLQDIARIAGVGLGTASRALRDAPGVAPATRDRVLAVAEELSYVVSPQASSLRLGSTGRIAVVGSTPGPLVLRGDAGRCGIGVAHGGAGHPALPGRGHPGPAGVLPTTPGPSQGRRRGNHCFSAGAARTTAPGTHGRPHRRGRRAISGLPLRLHRRRERRTASGGPPDLPGPPPHRNARRPSTPTSPVWSPRRSTAYYASLKDAGIPVDPQLVESNDWGGEHGAESMAKLLSLREPPDRRLTRTPTRSRSAPFEPCDGPGCEYRRTSPSSASTTTPWPSSPI